MSSISITNQLATSENLPYVCVPVSKHTKINISGMVASNKAFVTRGYRTKATLKICSTLIAWT